MNYFIVTAEAVGTYDPSLQGAASMVALEERMLDLDLLSNSGGNGKVYWHCKYFL